MRWLGLWLFACSMVVLGGCGGSDSEPTCDAGATQACVCTSGNMGAQVCNADGESWGACMCDGDAPSADPDDMAGDGNGAMGGVAMDSNPEPGSMTTGSGSMSGGSMDGTAMGGSAVTDPAPTGCGEPTCPFVSIWRIENDDESITLPLPESREVNGEQVPFNYDFEVNWGDGSAPMRVTNFDDADLYHLYADAGQYRVTVTGVMEAISFYDEDCSKLVEIASLGSVGWKSFDRAFYGCGNLGRVTGGDTSNVTDMSDMFYYATSANPDTSGWDTSSVTDMANMFLSARNANPDTSSWDTSIVTDMGSMFEGATSAIPDVSGWDTSSVTSMSQMFFFYGVPSANPDVSGWNTSSVTNMRYMFYGATSANPDVSSWNTSSVTDMNGMFSGATSANPDTSSWDTSSVRFMSGMFDGSAADQDTLDWYAEQCSQEPRRC